MTAYRLYTGDPPARFEEVEAPRPGYREALLKVAGVGLCRSDIHYLDAAPGSLPYPVPFTLGHENTGWVEEVGAGVTDFSPGDAVIADATSFCGRCDYCLRGDTNYCPTGITGRGFGRDGGLSNYLVVPDHELVKLERLDPIEAAPLADAGATSYRAVSKAMHRLRPGSTAVVIGTGGLGGFAVQYLRRLTQARVIAADSAPGRLQYAKEVGAHETLPSDASLPARLREATGGLGADAVLDFVGIDETIRTSIGAARKVSTVVIVGVGGGRVDVAVRDLPIECEVLRIRGYSIANLREVVALAEQGVTKIESERFPFDQVEVAYERLRAGELRSRAVVMPNR
jgi:alcohol dehydrogenase, propanol-preferring